MPIYEYEPCDRKCLICNGKVEVMQGVNDPPLKFCPYCGLEVRRVVSSANFKFKKDISPDKAAAKGFTTFKRAGDGRWEKMAGEGPAVIERTKSPDKERIEATPGHELVDEP